MVTEVEIGEMQLQANDCRPPPEARKRQGRIPLSLRGCMTPLILRFWTSNLHNCEKKFSVVLSHPVCGTLLQQP